MVWLPKTLISGTNNNLTGPANILSLYSLPAQQCRGKFAEGNKMGWNYFRRTESQNESYFYKMFLFMSLLDKFWIKSITTKALSKFLTLLILWLLYFVKHSCQVYKWKEEFQPNVSCRSRPEHAQGPLLLDSRVHWTHCLLWPNWLFYYCDICKF